MKLALYLLGVNEREKITQEDLVKFSVKIMNGACVALTALVGVLFVAIVAAQVMKKL